MSKLLFLCRSVCHWSLLTLFPIGALSCLVFFLTACQSTQANTIAPPTRMAVIDLHDPWQIYGTGMSVLHPNGLLYVINSASVAVIDDINIATVIKIPGPEGKIIDPRDSDYAETWGNYPRLSYLAVNEKTGHVHVLDSINHQMTVITGTKMITTVDSGGEIPKFITFDQETGLGYLSNLILSQDNPRPKQTIVFSDTRIITRLQRGRGLSPQSQLYNPVDGRTYIGHRHGQSEFEEEVGGVLTIIDGLEILTTTNLGNEELEYIENINTFANLPDCYL